MSRCQRLNGCLVMGWDEQSGRKLQEPPLSTADHRACGLAVFSVPFEPEDGRGDAAGARYRRLP